MFMDYLLCAKLCVTSSEIAWGREERKGDKGALVWWLMSKQGSKFWKPDDAHTGLAALTAPCLVQYHTAPHSLQWTLTCIIPLHPPTGLVVTTPTLKIRKLRFRVTNLTEVRQCVLTPMCHLIGSSVFLVSCSLTSEICQIQFQSGSGWELTS